MVGEKEVVMGLSGCFFVVIFVILKFLLNRVGSVIERRFSDVFDGEGFDVWLWFLWEMKRDEYGGI